MSPRRRLLVLNQYYWPGVEATAHLLTELCEALAAEYDVTVVTGRLRGREDAPDTEMRNGVADRPRPLDRVRPRPALAAAASNYVTYLGRAAARALSLGAAGRVLCMTDPPMVGALARAASAAATARRSSSSARTSSPRSRSS